MTAQHVRKIRVIISGCCGRMGQRLVALTLQAGDLIVAGAVESQAQDCLGRDVGECAGIGPVGVVIGARLDAVAARGDCLIEFSTPQATASHAEIAARLRCPMVIGTTGLSEGETRRIRRASRSIPILLSPNMSVGVNVLFRLAAEAAKTLGDGYDVEIVETHHAGKKDAPSGTATRLADVVARARARELRRVAVYGRRGMQPRVSHHEIGIHAVRAGDVVGDHQLTFATAGERLELTHRASSRDTFALGALRAARFIVSRRPGLYDMRDVLGLR